MAIITFVSDFGYADHYVAAVKARIFAVNPGLTIVDISHQIQPFDLAHAAHVLGSVFRDFAQGTVHLCAVNSVPEKDEHFIAAKLEDHYFVGPDNGLISLISDREPSQLIEIFTTEEKAATFPAKYVYARAAAMIASGANLDDLGKFRPEYKRLMPRRCRATKRQISGHVVRVDHYGNLVTNIERGVFDVLGKGRHFTVNFGRERLDAIHRTVVDVEAGECFVVFNSSGFLELGINKGNASELLGMAFDSPVSIVFDSDELEVGGPATPGA